MTIEEIEQKLNECQKSLAELKESKKECKWKPKKGETYWYRNPNKTMYVRKWANDEVDNALCNNTPIFPTQTECERYWHFMDTVKEKSYEFSKEDFENDDFYKYTIAYDFGLKNFYVDCVLNRKYFGEIYFKDKESAQYIIDNFKDELMEWFL